MSKENAKAFMEAVGNDLQLRAKVSALSGADALRDMVRLGAAHGFAFTESDYREAVVEFAGEQLSDEAIESLAREMGLE